MSCLSGRKSVPIKPLFHCAYNSHTVQQKEHAQQECSIKLDGRDSRGLYNPLIHSCLTNIYHLLFQLRFIRTERREKKFWLWKSTNGKIICSSGNIESHFKRFRSLLESFTKPAWNEGPTSWFSTSTPIAFLFVNHLFRQKCSISSLP